MIRGSNPGGGEICHACPDWTPRPTQPPIKWVKQPRHDADHSTEVATELE